MKRFTMFLATVLGIVILQYATPSTVKADTLHSMQSTLDLFQTTLMVEQAQAEVGITVHMSTWGALKSLYLHSANTNDATLDSTTAMRAGKPGAMSYSIGSSRYFVRNECWYALNHDWLYRGDDPNGPGGDGTESNYNWLSKNYDANANGLRFALGKYGGFVSDLIPGVGGRVDVNYWTDRLSADAYARGFRSSSSGHGCQCVSFVAMVIYRATGGRYLLDWNWDAMKSGYSSATLAKPGDIVFHTSGVHHVGICVINYGSGITVVDSNSQNNEVIRRHNVSNSEINNVGWKVMSGAGRWY